MKCEIPFPMRIFIAGARLDPDSDRHRADMLHLLSDDRQPVGQDRAMNIAEFFYHDFFLPGGVERH